MKWSEKVGLHCVQHGIINDDQLPWFIYGIEKRVASACTFPPFFLIALFLTTPWCAIALFVSFFLIRRRTSGFHANSVGVCLCVSLLLEVSLATLASYFTGLYDVSKGLLIGIAMATLLLCLAYILEWRKKNE